MCPEVLWYDEQHAIALQVFIQPLLTASIVRQGTDARSQFFTDVPHDVDLICDTSAVKRIRYDVLGTQGYINRHKSANLRYVVFVGVSPVLAKVIQSTRRYIHRAQKYYFFADTLTEASEIIMEKRSHLREPAKPTLV